MRRLFQPSPALHPVTPDTPRAPAEQVGAVMAGRYRVEAYLAGGGFAHIYAARDLKLNTLRAIKEATYLDGASRRQFEEEADMLINASHPHLVRGYALLSAGQKRYLVMEYIDGPTAEDVVIEHAKAYRCAPDAAVALGWILPICDAVRALHAQPIAVIHRDIKPANIQIECETGRPVLIDLGLAKSYRPGTRTFAAALAFTPGYAPPEQYQASGATDQRTDVYALGATLFFLLTGFQPVEAPARLTGTPQPRPSERNAALGPALDAIIMRAMALDPRDRYQSAIDLQADLRATRDRLVEPAGVRAGYASGGPVPMRACSRCGAASPGFARFCCACGTPFGSYVDDDDLSAWVGSGKPNERTTPLPAVGAGGLVAVSREGAVMVRYDVRHDEARMTILALIAMLTITLGLVGFYAPVFLLATVLGIGLGHSLLGFRAFAHVLGWRMAWRAHQLPVFHVIPWNPALVAAELRLPLRLLLAGGYLMLVAWLALWLLVG